MKRLYYEPVTGDALTLGEYISWKVQGVIRRWSFLLVFVTFTVICWSTRNDIVLLWWNFIASFLAIVIESVVGMGMFGQARRDAKVLREVRKMSEKQELLLERIEVLEQQNLEQLTRIDLVLETMVSEKSKRTTRKA